ncbi:hypothetical protein MNBD_GAMMA22-1410 [hydrothermal vent metagenome]|uniref:General secretion pathway protein N n=1 Tax=hydrothermal vent metagenome TaxID=652676 RepID=A0A3B1AHV0_9ZZZZ
MNNLQIMYQSTIDFLKNNWKIVSLSFLLYCFFLISSLPAKMAIAWIMPKSNSDVSIVAPEGSIWSGKLASVGTKGINVNNFRWDLNLFPLLYGNLSVDFIFGDKETRGTGVINLAMGSNRIEVENLMAKMPISFLQPLMVGVPAKLDGQLSAHFDSIVYAPGDEILAKGNLVWNSAAITVMQTVQLGDLKLSLLPRDKGSHGLLKDAGGPLILDGTVQLSNKGQYQAAIKVGTRSTAEAALKQSMPFLGRAGADGKIQIRRSGRLPF